MKKMRVEKDLVGQMEIPEDALYGIHACRAKENFSNDIHFHKEWYQAIGTVKKSVYYTVKLLLNAAKSSISDFDAEKVYRINIEKLDYLTEAAERVENGEYFDHFIVPAISGGAGTSINMNINEVIANLALLKSARQIGDYQFIDPIDQANIFQSTNDVVPTGLKIALMRLLNQLEEAINGTRHETEELEKKYRDVFRMGYTQLQKAVPSTYGRLFGMYNDALSRDWWRISKCFERIKSVNMGGGAIGSGISIPRFFIMEIVPVLQKFSRLPIARSENMMDTTSNQDGFVEIHGILKAHAVNLEKMAFDMRLLSSDINVKPEVELPARQTGSSIMPGKINPVIPEFVISVAHKIYSNDQILHSMAGQGALELNPYIPMIGHALIESIKLLIQANRSLSENLFQGITIKENNAYDNLINSPSISTVLIPFIGYHKAGEIAKFMKEKNCSIFQANDKLLLIETKKLKEIMKSKSILLGGYSLKDIT